MREQDLEFNPEYKYAKGGKASDETYREVYQHKYIPTMTFEITGETANGYKGIQKDKKSLSKLERTKGKKVSYSSSDLKDLFTKMYAKGGDLDDDVKYESYYNSVIKYSDYFKNGDGYSSRFKNATNKLGHKTNGEYIVEGNEIIWTYTDNKGQDYSSSEQPSFRVDMGNLIRKKQYAKGGKTKKFPKGFIDYVEESDNVYEDNGLYYNVETQYAKAFTLQELYDWTQKEGYEFAKGGIAKKSEYISNRDIVSLTHKKGGTKKTLKGSQLVDGAYAKKKIMRKKPTKSDQLSLLNKGGDILRAYDVNVNSGVGTYARGGKISKDDAIVKALKMGVDFNKDFHAQSFGGELTELAKETGYRKSKSSSGSTGRAFFEHLERRYDKNPSYYNDMVKSYARGGQTNETINLKSYNLSGKVINSGKFIADYENETITFPSGKTYKVVKDYEWTSKVLKTKIKAIGGIRGFVKFLKEINTPDSPFNPSMTNAYINNGKKARGGKMAVGGKTTMAGDTDFPSQMLNYAKGGTIIKKGNRVRVVNTQYDGKQGLVVSNDLQNGNYQVQIDGKVKGFPFENLMLLSRETYAKGGEVAKYKTGITKYGKNQYAVRVDIGDKDLIPKLLNDRWDSRSKAEAFAKRLAKRNNGTYVGEDGLWAKGGKTKSIMSKKDIGVVIPKTYQIGDKEFGNTYKVERINTKKYSDNDKNRHYNFRIWEYDKSLDLFDEIKSPSAKLKALERIEMSKDYAKGGKFASGGNVSYNGWTNYATWVTNLEILDGMDWKDYNMGEPISAEQIEDYVQEVMEQSPELAVSFANRFLNDVNYYEIVEHINDDFDLDDGEKDEYAKGGDVKNSGYKLAEEEIELIDKFNRVGFDNKVFTHYLTESKNADKETYYNHKVYNPFKDTTEYLGQFRDRGEAIDSFYSYKPKSYAKGGQMKKPMIRYSGRR